MNILITAPFTRAEKGSEDGLAWGIIKVLATEHDILLITSTLSKGSLEAALTRNPQLRIKAFYVPWKRFSVPAFLKQFEFDFVNRMWNRRAFELAKNIQRSYQIDAYHRLGLQGFREPGYLWKNDGKYVIGPLAGLGMVPWQLFQFLPLRSRLRYFLRNIGIMYAFKFNRRINSAISNADAVVAPTRKSVKTIKETWGKDSYYIRCLSCPTVDAKAQPPERCSGGPLRLAWAGDFNAGKALNILILALSELRSLDFTLEVVGDGLMADQWAELVRRENLSEKVNFMGRRTRDETMRIIGRSHLFVWVSVIDSMPNVMLEAVSMGVPVICLDHPEYIDFLELGGGLAVDTSNRRSIISALAENIAKVYHDEPARLKIAAAAKETSLLYSDAARSEQFLSIYDDITNSWAED